MDVLHQSEFDNFMTRCPDCGYPLLSSIYKCPNHRDYKVISVFDYKNKFSRQVLFDYKFNKKRKLSKYFAEILNKYVQSDETVIPIPSSDISVKKRGWDQMLEITKYMNNQTFCCLKNNSTVQQKLLNRQQRITSSENKFCLSKEITNEQLNKSYVIIDDVLTTGATVNDAVNVLKNAGITNIRVITLFAEL